MLKLPVYLRGSSFYLHTRINGKQVKRSLCTSDRLTAMIRACHLLHNARIASITHQQMIAALRKIEERGAGEIAHRIKATCARIFSYANQLGIENKNPAADLKDVLKPVKAGHFAAISPDELKGLLEAIYKNDARLYLFNFKCHHIICTSAVGR